MPFWRKKPFNRIEAMAKADRHRAKGHRRRAISGFRKVLAVDPSDVAVHGKLAPLLAETGQMGEALASFHLAAHGHLQAGFADRAIAVYVQASAFFPLEVNLWEELGGLYQGRGRRMDAVNAYVNGGSKLGARADQRADGARLLSRALGLEPWHPAATLALAKVFAADKRKDEALTLLTTLVTRIRGTELRRARGALFKLSPTPKNAFFWVRALLQGR
jgi:thioredoxin-like negative regulator of GroEL